MNYLFSFFNFIITMHKMNKINNSNMNLIKAKIKAPTLKVIPPVLTL